MKEVRDLVKMGIDQKDRVLVFMPHPDDEAVFVSGLLKKLTRAKIAVKVVIMTRGEASTLRHGLKEGEDLAEARDKEMEKSLRILGVKEYSLLDIGDGKLKNKIREMVKEIGKQINEFKPTALVTLEPDGIYGHPDHIALSLAVTRSIKKLLRLLYATIPDYKVKPRASSMAEKVEINPLLPHFVLKLGVIERLAKLRVLMAHKTQFNMTNKSANDSNFFKINKMLDFEYYVYKI